MSDLETFRAEIRAWLEANCPPEMRQPARDEDDVCWGGRNFMFQIEAQKQWLERCAAKGYTVPDWPKAYGGAGLIRRRNQDLAPGNGKARLPLPAQQLRHLDARASTPEIRHRRAEGPLSEPDRARRNPLVPGLFRTGIGQRSRLACRPLARTRAIIGSSTARKSGPATPTRPTGFSASSAPTRRTNIRAFHFLLFDMTTPGVIDQADPADLRRITLLRDVLRQCDGAQAPDRRRAQSRLGRRQISARP